MHRSCRCCGRRRGGRPRRQRQSARGGAPSSWQRHRSAKQPWRRVSRSDISLPPLLCPAFQPAPPPCHVALGSLVPVRQMMVSYCEQATRSVLEQQQAKWDAKEATIRSELAAVQETLREAQARTSESQARAPGLAAFITLFHPRPACDSPLTTFLT